MYTASIVTVIAWDVVIIALSALRQYLQAGRLCDAMHVFCLYTQLRRTCTYMHIHTCRTTCMCIEALMYLATCSTAVDMQTHTLDSGLQLCPNINSL